MLINRLNDSPAEFCRAMYSSKFPMVYKGSTAEKFQKGTGFYQLWALKNTRMSTSKILLCVIGAAAAGVVVGKLLTSGKAGEVISSLRNAAGDFLGKATGEVDKIAGADARQRAEFDQANTSSPGHA